MLLKNLESMCNFLTFFFSHTMISKHYDLKRLICNVNYTTEKDEKMGFKKFFKFIVSKPFEIQPKFPVFEVRLI